jgi:hypothetical protein
MDRARTADVEPDALAGPARGDLHPLGHEGRPGERDRVDALVEGQRDGDVDVAGGDDVEHAARQHVEGDPTELDRGGRGLRRRLQHDRPALHEHATDLPERDGQG